MESIAEKKYKKIIAQQINCQTEQLFLYWKGRVALFTALIASGVTRGDEVVLQAFTCVVVPNAIFYTGATPVYVDIKKVSFNTTLEQIKAKVSAKTKVIITQNTFGLSSEASEIAEFCKQKGIVNIEDCTHGFGGTHKDRINGSYADFAFYSTQWNKPFSTGIGGVLRVNNEIYLNKVREVDQQAISPSIKEKLVLKALILSRDLLLNDTTYWILIKVYRQLTKWNLVIGSSTPGEIEAPKQPLHFLKKGCDVQYEKGIKSLSDLPDILNKRTGNAIRMTKFLKERDKTYVNSEIEKDHSFLLYPVLVTDRIKFMKLTEDAGLPIGDWFISPIHPVTEKFELWGLQIEDFPMAVSISNKIINIPLDVMNLDKYFAFLDTHKQLIC